MFQIVDRVSQIVGLTEAWEEIGGEVMSVPEKFGEMPMAVSNVLQDETAEMCRLWQVGEATQVAGVMFSISQMAFLMGREFGKLEMTYPLDQIKQSVPMAVYDDGTSTFMRLIGGIEEEL